MECETYPDIPKLLEPFESDPEIERIKQRKLEEMLKMQNQPTVEPGIADLDESNFGLHEVKNGKITTSWNDIEGQNFEGTLFTLVFTANEDAMLSDVLKFGSTLTPAAAYTENSGEMNVDLKFSGANQVVAGFELYQNQPNPFTVETVIGFNLPEAMMVDLQIFDVTGKTVKVISGEYQKGHNEIKVNSNELDAAGVLYYQLNTMNYTATKKMILVK